MKVLIVAALLTACSIEVSDKSVAEWAHERAKVTGTYFQDRIDAVANYLHPRLEDTGEYIQDRYDATASYLFKRGPCEVRSGKNCGKEPTQAQAEECTITQIDSKTYFFSCPDGSAAVLTNGSDGKDGTNGSDGADGSAGANGVNGSNGSTGATGSAGSNGTIGATGSTGTTGSTGPTGSPGPAGADAVTCTIVNRPANKVLITCGTQSVLVKNEGN